MLSSAAPTLGRIAVSHRLDRGTSGVLIFTRNLAADRRIKAELAERRVSKQYLAKVEGVFPEGEVVCAQPLDTLIHSLGVVRVSKEGKESRTRFRRLATDGRHSLVTAFPATGRTHQIRVHLQYLGYPIDNDSFYNCDSWGPAKGKDGQYGEGRTPDDVAAAIRQQHFYGHYEEVIENLEQSAELGTEAGFEEAKRGPDYQAYCPQCHRKQFLPTVDQLALHLHCWRYSGEKWSFEAPPPPWAAAMLPDDVRSTTPTDFTVASAKSPGSPHAVLTDESSVQ